MKKDNNISVDIVLPVYNEEKILKKNVLRLMSFLKNNIRQNWKIIISNNGSTDRTINIAKELAAKHTEIGYLDLSEKGKGRAIREAWLQSDANIVSFMDIDLSSDIRFFPDLISSIIKEEYDIVIGSRILKGAQVKRSIKREFASRFYNLLLKFVFRTKIYDTHCGFKAMKKNAADDILPETENQKFFFDTELLIIAEKKGYKIKEIPIKWIEDSESKVKTISLGIKYLLGIIQLRRKLKKKSF